MGNELNILQIIWESGLVVKLVLLLLIAASVISWAIFIKKKKEFQALKESNDNFIELYQNADRLKDVLKETQERPFSPFGAMFVNGYQELLKISDKFVEGRVPSTKDSLEDHFSKFGMGLIERALKKGSNESNEKFEHLQAYLASIGSVTPYIGLFGTVWGIINSFTGLAEGGGSIDLVAPGIAEALVATAMGLFAAIPAVLSFNYFNKETEVWNSQMDSFAQEFLNMVERSIISK